MPKKVHFLVKAAVPLKFSFSSTTKVPKKPTSPEVREEVSVKKLVILVSL